MHIKSPEPRDFNIKFKASEHYIMIESEAKEFNKFRLPAAGLGQFIDKLIELGNQIKKANQINH